MSYNQKIFAVITLIAVGVTGAVSFILFDPPYSTNFKIEVAFIVLSQLLLGMMLIAKFGKGDSDISFSPVCFVVPVNLLYFVFTLAMAFFTDSSTKVFALWHGVGLAVTMILGLVFQMVAHNVEEQSKNELPPQKIEHAKVTWR